MKAGEVSRRNVKESVRFRMAVQDLLTGCTQHMAYIGLDEGGYSLQVQLCK